ncbi:putative gustatory receptor 28b [Temnothorax curvispinosus]|uniref:Gustatory receptor n=1 Tax=Temnothorax curvispinosus TaxID=300111 RepID=A0A6J1RB93_9HYME|nr:putative gustatory receptor 28b [Temnothorax curvispinosus]
MEISSTLPPELYQKLSRLIYAKDIFGLFYLIGKLFAFYILFYMAEVGISYIIFEVYTVLVVFTMDMLYMNCVCTLKACFKEINNNLLHMQAFIVNNEPCVPILPMMFCYGQRNAFLIMNLKALKKQHLMVSNTVQMLNTIFSLQLLATIVIIFAEIIFGLYFHVVQYNRYDGFFINLDEEIGLIFLETIYYVTKMALLVWTCETGKNQAQEIRTTIHDVLIISRDEQIKNELQLFSLQILHCKNTFSAKGLNVDATFLATLVGAITTYMLILLQFLVISQACDEKSAINGTRIM